MYGGQGWPHTKLRPYLVGSSHTPPSPRPNVSQNPIWVGSQHTILARCVGQAAFCTASARQSAIPQWNSGDSQAWSTPPGLKHVGCGRGVPQPLALRGAFSRAYLPSVLVPFVPYGFVSPVCSLRSGVPKACALGG